LQLLGLVESSPLAAARFEHYALNERFAGASMTTESGQEGAFLRLGLATLVILFGLCTVFATVATVAQAWQKNRQARWPQVTARVDTCGITRNSTNGRRRMYIRCRLSYAIDNDRYTINIYSRMFPAPEVAQYPANQGAPFEAWVNRYPEGSSIDLRYDPADHGKAVLAVDDMPGSPQTRQNMILLEFFAAGFLILLMILRVTRQRSHLANASGLK
jgi:hypothetical protein